MDKIYFCEPCFFKTNNLRSFKRHITCDKHKNNIKKYKLLRYEKSKKGNIINIFVDIKNNDSDFVNININIDGDCDGDNIDNGEGSGNNGSSSNNSYIDNNDSYISYKNEELIKLIKEKDIFLHKTRNEANRHIAVIREKNKRLRQYENEIKFYRKTLELNKEGKINSKKYINAKYKNVTNLKSLPYSKFKTNRNILYINDYQTKDEGIVRDVIYSFEHSTLDSYIGDVILNQYKKIPANKRQVWITDISRLKFIVRRKINDICDKNKNKKKNKCIDNINDDNSCHIDIYSDGDIDIDIYSDGDGDCDDCDVDVDGDKKYYWYTDLGGKYTIKKLINPTLKEIKNKITRYQEKLSKYINNNNNTNLDKNQIMKNNEIMISIMFAINDTTLHKKILKYIAPHFIITDNIQINTSDDDV
jgi:hypothetical protein